MDDCDELLLLEAANTVDCRLEITKPKAEHIECLKANFGHNAFRPKQWDIIRSIIVDKRDNCVIMPTGYGKSLLFQFPAVFTGRITMVVSPLISLMQDQVLALNLVNIAACFLGSAQKNRNIVNEVREGCYRLVYVSPEYLNGDAGQELLQALRDQLVLIAIDEAHCVSQWGHDFRPDYRKLNSIRNIVPDVPILTVTATATSFVRVDIVNLMNLHDPQIVRMNLDRPNIEFIFQNKSQDIWNDLKPFTTNVRGSVIIYVPKRATTDEIVAILRKYGVHCDSYHSMVSLKKRKEILENFIRDHLQVIVATVAFGMGIDKPDVRYVIHYGASKNIETYYQEIGRAGRDGFPSKAITFFDAADFTLNEWMALENHEHKSKQVVDHLMDLGRKMKELCHTTGCRREFILNYFESKCQDSKSSTKCCDNCSLGRSSIKINDEYEGIDANGKFDFTENANLFLQALMLTSKSSVAINVLRGSCEKSAMRYKGHKIYGAGKLMHKDYWRAFVIQLKQEKFLEFKKTMGPFRPSLIMSPTAQKWMTSAPRKPLCMKPAPEILPFLPKKRRATLNNNLGVRKTVEQTNNALTGEKNASLECTLNDKQLEQVLMSIRTALAEHNDCMPHLVASNMAIFQMIEKKPTSIEEFKCAIIDGFSIAKIEKFAKTFVEGINRFMSNDFCMDVLLRRYPMQKPAMTNVIANEVEIKRLIQSKLCFNDIEMVCNAPIEDITSVLIDLMRNGDKLTKNELLCITGVNEDTFKFVKAHVSDEGLRNEDFGKLAEELYQMNPFVTKPIVAIIFNYLEIRKHLSNLNCSYFDPDEEKLINASALLNGNTQAKPEFKTFSKQASQFAITDNSSDSFDAFISEIELETLVDFPAIKSEGKKSPTTEKPMQNISTVSTSLAISNASMSEHKPEAIPSTSSKSMQNISTIPTSIAISKASISDHKSEPIPLTSSKRVIVTPASNVVYCDDEDSSDSSTEKPQLTQQRRLPQWLISSDKNTAQKENHCSRSKRPKF